MRILLLLFFVVLGSASWSEPRPYTVTAKGTAVNFIFDLSGAEYGGRIPAIAADALIDLRTLKNSSVNVSASVNTIVGTQAFVTDAMRSAAVLDVKNHPKITFRSTKVAGTPKAAVIDGILTIKGVSQPVRLNGKLLRRANSAKDDFSQLVIQLNGQVNRFDFGVDGYPKLIGPIIKLDLRVTLLRQ